MIDSLPVLCVACVRAFGWDDGGTVAAGRAPLLPADAAVAGRGDTVLCRLRPSRFVPCSGGRLFRLDPCRDGNGGCCRVAEASGRVPCSFVAQAAGSADSRHESVVRILVIVDAFHTPDDV